MYVNSTAIIAELCVYLLTWNVASKSPSNIDMNDMLTINKPSSCPGGNLPNLYVLGFQEVDFKSINEIMFSSENEWTTRIGQHLSNRNYVQVGIQKLQGILINVWSQSKHLKNINSIETTSIATGFGNIVGNKGAVSVRMNLYGAPTTFVVAHLAAHDENLKQRIDDYERIVSKHLYKTKNYNLIFQHDLVFWSGDLNFRLNGADNATTISNKIRNGQLSELFAHDQLHEVQKSGKAFNVLNEATPLFPPTFKFKKGTSEYDLKRRPAWCDRILYRAVNYLPGIALGLKQLSYKSHPQYLISDHKPVTAEFLFTIGVDRNINSLIH